MSASFGPTGPDLDSLVPPADCTELSLSDQVREALKTYLSHLEGIDEATGLHALVLGEVERPLFETVLELCSQNQSKAAQVLGISRSTLRKKMSQYQLR